MKNLSILLLIICYGSLKAQNLDFHEIEFRMILPEITLLSIAPENSTVLLAMEKTEIAGEKLIYKSKQDQLLYLNYTCSIAPDNASKNLSAQIISGTVPRGLELELSLSEYRGTGKGKFGIPLPKISLQNYPQNIISNIGGSYTNQGLNNGHQLVYDLKVTNYKLLDAESSNTLTIVFTISDN